MRILLFILFAKQNTHFYDKIRIFIFQQFKTAAKELRINAEEYKKKGLTVSVKP